MQAHWPLFLGAEPGAGGTHFRVWAPTTTAVELELYEVSGDRHFPLTPEASGLFSATIPGVGNGARYKFKLDGGHSYPDPYSRWQPDGPHGPSSVVDAKRFRWHDASWRGVAAEELVIYECHVGTYTQAGTFDALIPELAELKSLGITALELMPVSEFAGRRNWGYDGVDLFAPASVYGGPDALKRLVDAAHRLGLAILLDVVYNHLGPSGNYLRAFAPQYFTERYKTPWGEALNYDGPDSRWARHLAVENACYWLNEYRVDGLRLDATHAIFDRSAKHITQEIAERARQSVGDARRIVIVAEDSSNDVAYIRPVNRGGRGLDGVWADDFHHAMRVGLTGERDGYFADYSGDLREIGQAISYGFLYQGQRSRYFGYPRGTKITDELAQSFVFCIQNHDQVGNRAFGDRLHHAVDQAQHLLAAAVLLLAPETPLLFMGQEFAASTPFLYFTDHEPDLGRLVTAGRREEFARFAAFDDPALRDRIPDPQAESTFLASKLDLSERQKNADVYRCYRDLLLLRRTDPVLRVPDRRNLAVGVPSPNVLAMHRWQDGEHRLLLANFGAPTELSVVSEASNRANNDWQLFWSSVKPDYWDASREHPSLQVVAQDLAGSPVLVIAAPARAYLLRLPEKIAILLTLSTGH